MAKIGSFGSLVFSVSENTVKTFDGMNWDFSADYATHDRHIKADLLEYMGPGIESISFSMTLSVFLGVNPLKEIKKLREMKGIRRTACNRRQGIRQLQVGNAERDG
jgi:hypothetical protein